MTKKMYPGPKMAQMSQQESHLSLFLYRHTLERRCMLRPWFRAIFDKEARHLNVSAIDGADETGIWIRFTF